MNSPRLDSFLKDRRDTGQLDSEGTFTLSPRLQYSRLQDALSESPANFVLKIVQGFVGMGARSISISIGRAGVVFKAEGLAPQGSLRERLQDQHLGSQRDPLDDLALGILSGARSGFPEIQWSLEGLETCAASGPELAIETLGKLAESSEVRLSMPLGFALRNLLKLARLRAEIECAVVDRCSYAPCGIRLGRFTIEPKNLGKAYHGREVVVGFEIYTDKHGNTHRRNIMGRYGYQYWGVLHLRGGRTLGFSLPALPGDVHCVADGSRVEMAPEHSRSWGAFVLFHAERAQDGIVGRCKEPEGKGVLASAFLLADTETPGNLLVLLHRGVLLEVIPCELGSSRVVILTSADTLDLDASTLRVVQNQRFEALLKELRKLTERLLSEVNSRQPYRPKGTEASWRNLYG